MGSIPDNGVSTLNHLVVGEGCFGTDVESEKSGGNSVLEVSDEDFLRSVLERADEEVFGEVDLDTILLGLLHDGLDLLGTLSIIERVTDLEAMDLFQEGESHTSAHNHLVDSVEEVHDQLQLVLDLGSSENHGERLFRGLEHLGEVLDFLLKEETGSSLGEVDTDHGAVSSVGGSESVVDIDVTKSGESLSE